jgi:dolichyl-phosphate mannosyltransferase polypeptide 3
MVPGNSPIETTVANLAIIQQLPFWALISFGSLLLFRLGLGVMTFNDVPDAHKELMAEIDLAKADLRNLGVDVD